MSDRSLSHLDPFSGTRMVDVSPKEATHRRALARCKVAMKPETTAGVANNAITKGDVLAAARVAGIQAAKRTADLVPMRHPLLVGAVHVDFTIGDDYVEVEAKVEAVDRTGVEMEAMTASAVAADCLRHVQDDRQDHEHWPAHAVGEDRRKLRRLETGPAHIKGVTGAGEDPYFLSLKRFFGGADVKKSAAMGASGGVTTFGLPWVASAESSSWISFGTFGGPSLEDVLDHRRRSRVVGLPPGLVSGERLR